MEAKTDRAGALSMPLTRDSILRRILNCHDLPTLPEVVRRVADTVENEHAPPRTSPTWILESI